MDLAAIARAPAAAATDEAVYDPAKFQALVPQMRAVHSALRFLAERERSMTLSDLMDSCARRYATMLRKKIRSL